MTFGTDGKHKKGVLVQLKTTKRKKQLHFSTNVAKHAINEGEITRIDMLRTRIVNHVDLLQNMRCKGMSSKVINISYDSNASATTAVRLDISQTSIKVPRRRKKRMTEIKTQVT